MNMTKLFLATVGLLYLGLACWCVFKPYQTSQAVGFELKPGSGQSEFLVIYGGLQLALALILLLPLVSLKQVESVLIFCVVVHACLVAFRTASFFRYTGIQSTTSALAVGEWIILLFAIWRIWKGR